MQIVIEMSEHEYEVALRDGWVHGFYSEKIKNGIPLPKGHGRLVDENDLVKDFNTFQDAFVINVAHGFALRVVCKAPTIIEADKEAEDADSN